MGNPPASRMASVPIASVSCMSCTSCSSLKSVLFFLGAIFGTFALPSPWGSGGRFSDRQFYASDCHGVKRSEGEWRRCAKSWDIAMHRRNFLKASALTPAVVAIGSTPLLGQAATPLAELSDSLDFSLFSSDDLAVPIADKPTVSPLAKGLDRALVLGGGGTYISAGIAASSTACSTRASMRRPWLR